MICWAATAGQLERRDNIAPPGSKPEPMLLGNFTLEGRESTEVEPPPFCGRDKWQQIEARGCFETSLKTNMVEEGQTRLLCADLRFTWSRSRVANGMKRGNRV